MQKIAERILIVAQIGRYFPNTTHEHEGNSFAIFIQKEAFYASFCPGNSPCGSTACVDIYKAGPDNVWPSGLPHDDASIVDNDHKWHLVDLELFSPIDDLDKLTLWTRAFFEVKFTLY